MAPSVLREVQRLPISLSEAWRFFSAPRNLPRITPPSIGVEVTSDLPGEMYTDRIITYRVRPIPWISVGWVTEITHVREPSLFVDEQRFGPYRFWHHSTTSGRSRGASRWKTSSITPSRSAISGGSSAARATGSGVGSSPGQVDAGDAPR